jgi:GntR family transcriptional regulator
MLTVQVDRAESTSLHDLVAAEARRTIAEGEAGPGECLPWAQDLAAVRGVNKNTVLRDLDFQRGRGITVGGSAERSAVVHRIRDLIEYCRNQGCRRDGLIPDCGAATGRPRGDGARLFT